MQDLSAVEQRRARIAIRLFGLAAVLFGLLMASYSWSILQRPDTVTVCQHTASTAPSCKRTGLYAGAVFVMLGLPALLVRRRWLDRNMRRSAGPFD